ncbi:MAG: hypothetical protein HY905_01565 [Deltaproteobacteria bacterium]|nr:hypothetical protein [Deltaproteobacteria bacterium]
MTPEGLVGDTEPRMPIPLSGPPDEWNWVHVAAGDGFAVTWRLLSDDIENAGPNRSLMAADLLSDCSFRFGFGYFDGQRCGETVESWYDDRGLCTPRFPLGIAGSGSTWTVMVGDVIVNPVVPFVCRSGEPKGPDHGDAPRTTSLELYDTLPRPREDAFRPVSHWSYDFSEAVGSSVAVLRSGPASSVALAFAERDAVADEALGWRVEVRTFDWTTGEEPATVGIFPAEMLGTTGPLEVADIAATDDHLLLAFYSGARGPTRTAHLALLPWGGPGEDRIVPNTSLGARPGALRLARAPGSVLVTALCSDDPLDPSAAPNRAYLWHAASDEALLADPDPALVLDPTHTNFYQIIPAGVASGSYGLAITDCDDAEIALACDIDLVLFGCR